MSRFLKTLLLWILIAVVPLNAAVAAMGISCSPAHQQTLQMQAAQDGAAGHEHHGAQAEQPAPAPHDGSSDSAPSQCSAASALCIGAAAPPPACAAGSLVAGLEIPALGASPKVAGFIPDGPQRPPRAIAG